MKIAYVIYHDITKNDGVTKKVAAHKEAWESLGHEVEVFCLLPKTGSSDLRANQCETGGQYFKQRLFVNHWLYDGITKFSPDFIYMRYDTWSITIEKLSKQFPLVLELNTDDLSEFWLLFRKEKTIKSFIRYFSYKLFRGRLLRSAKLLVGVTEELANMENFKHYCNQSIVSTNSIKLSNFEQIKQLDQNHRIALFFIGTPGQPWHGVDRIAGLAHKLPEFDFHVVGIEGADQTNIFYHGYMQQASYLEVLAKCNICIGPLALDRYGLKQAAPLKVREYLAYGYPVIFGYEDVAFSGSAPDWGFFGDFSSINDDIVEKFRAFVLKNSNRIVDRAEIHSYVDSVVVEERKLANMAVQLKLV